MFVNDDLTIEQIENKLKELSIKLVDGGKSYTTLNSNCNSSSTEFKRIAFILPHYRRFKNLKTFLHNMHIFWTKQKIDYGVYVIEPDSKLNYSFNRALSMNIGFIESIRDKLNMTKKDEKLSVEEILKMNDTYWDCWVFHDVDMVPEDERLIYTCNKDKPMKYAIRVRKFNYV